MDCFQTCFQEVDKLNGNDDKCKLYILLKLIGIAYLLGYLRFYKSFYKLLVVNKENICIKLYSSINNLTEMLER